MSVKASLRNCVARLLFATGVTNPARRGRGQLSVVTFHRVLPELERRAYPYPGLVVTPQELGAFLSYFTEHFDCGSLTTQHERYVGGEKTARPLLAITFDDGQHDNYRYARPVLAEYGVKASFFIPVQAVEKQELLWHDRLGFSVLALLEQANGREKLLQMLKGAGLSGSGPHSLVVNVVEESKTLALSARLRLVETLSEASGTAGPPEFARLMTFEELADLAADGHEIGSHSMTHCLMPECDHSSLRYELEESRRVLQVLLGRRIESFCYPNGSTDGRTANAVARAGYIRAVTTNWGGNGPGADPFQLHRCDMDVQRVRDSAGKFNPAIVAFRMSGFNPGLD